MAIPSLQLIAAIRSTAKRLSKSQSYQWGHMGQCNCGYLTQEITRLSDAEIHKAAMKKSGDWADQIRDYCPSSGLPMDTIIEKLTEQGLSTQDLINLERLSDSNIRKRIPNDQQLNHNKKEDVIAYFNAWADALEEEFLKQVSAHSNKESTATLSQTIA